MAVQVIPLIKALGPYVAQIATSAIPAFTSKPEAVKADPVVAQQIKELQEAATKSATDLHSLAEHLQKVIATAEAAGESASRRIATYKALIFLSLGVSTAALVVALIAIASV
jgi:hypothetical protein